MPLDTSTTFPTVDGNVCGKWSSVDHDRYNKLDVFLTAFTALRRKDWAIWKQLVPGRLSWKANMGPLMRSVAQEYSPLVRQEAYPKLISETPLTDMHITGERTLDVRVYRQRFKTRDFNFLPDWQDFFKHAVFEYEDMVRQIAAYENVFLRSRAFHLAPYVYLCGVGLVDAPTGIPTAEGVGGKDFGTVANWLEKPLKPLSMDELIKIYTVGVEEIGMTPYSGSGLPGKANDKIQEVFKLVMHNSDWLRMTTDPYTRENKRLSLDIVTDTLKGKPLGLIETQLERHQLRYAFDGTDISLPTPEIVSLSDQQVERYRVRPNPPYANSRYAVSFFIGGNFGSALDSGPPPDVFSKTVDAVRGMDWNGKPRWTRKFLIECENGLGGKSYELAEEWSENIRGLAQLALGYRADNAFNVLPVVHLRDLPGLPTSGLA